jgi:hypothetical protein
VSLFLIEIYLILFLKQQATAAGQQTSRLRHNEMQQKAEQSEKMRRVP